MKVYQENLVKYNDRIIKLNKVLKRISLLRLLIFLISGMVLIYLFNINLITPVYFVLPVSIICFGAVINYHSKIAFLKKHTEFLTGINESEIQRKNGDLEVFDSGQKFIDPNHPYTSDLDVFGQHSIFQIVNRTTTESGMILLSEWLSQPASKSQIDARQKAIIEISQKLDWRQDFEASGMHFQNKKSDYNKLLSWVEAPNVLLKYRHRLIIISIILPSLILFSSYFFYVNLGSFNAVIFLLLILFLLVINIKILKNVSPLAENIVETSTKNLNTLRGYHTLIKKIESEGFNSNKLNDLRSIFIDGKYSAYEEINRLCKILDYSQQRGMKGDPLSGNQFYPFLNLFLLLDIHLIIDTEKWKSKNKSFLKLWAEVVSEYEVLNSFAGFYYSNPDYSFPEITEKNNYVHFESIGHPLITSGKRVCNNFHSEGAGDIVMITGSNMAGKSTFLRAVGVNIILGLAGAPCCSKRAEISHLQLYSSMRTEDNLKKGISSFYAELSRIEKMLKLIESNNNVFFLLDEMFKGTNSEDRQRGGYSFINQINKLTTSGIIATHDIELAKISDVQNLVTNYSFNSEIRNDSMIFSYKLQPGICSDFNASALMEKSGIKIVSIVPKSEIK